LSLAILHFLGFLASIVLNLFLIYNQNTVMPACSISYVKFLFVLAQLRAEPE